jgi:hypothetical protein
MPNSFNHGALYGQVRAAQRHLSIDSDLNGNDRAA